MICDRKIQAELNSEKHEEICQELKATYYKKNLDYGDSFHKTFEEEGFAMPRIRLTDKLERFKSLSKSNEQMVKDESLEDTLLDLANYAIMTVMEIRRMRGYYDKTPLKYSGIVSSEVTDVETEEDNEFLPGGQDPTYQARTNR